MILACDIGLKRIGLAIGIDEIILPLEPILRKNRNQAAMALDCIIQEKQIQTLVIGIPYSQSKQCQQTKERIIFFSKLLKSNVKKIFVDEDFTSIEASHNIQHFKKEKKALKNGRLDSLAACEILRRYLSNPNASLMMS